MINKLVSLLILVVLLVGCVEQIAPVHPLTASSTPIPPTVTDTLEPSATAAPSPTVTNTATATFQPTATPVPLVSMEEFMKGIVFPGGYPHTYETRASDWSLDNIVMSMGANWIRLHTGCSMESYLDTKIECNVDRYSTDSEIVHVTEKAHGLGLRVMYTFNIMERNGRVGGNHFGDTYTEKQWDEWFEEYQEHLLYYARLAEELHIDALDIAQELKGLANPKNEQRMRAVIAAVREVYSGPLLYSADEETDWERIRWWDAVDYIGIHPYNFHLTRSRNGTLEEMKASWKPIIGRLETLSKRWDRPIVITEIGYPSQDGIGMDMNNFQQWWDVDLQESADLYQAALESFWGKDWFKGFFAFNIDAIMNASDPNNTQYTIYGKPAANVIRTFYGAPTVNPTPPPTPPASFSNREVIYDDEPKWLVDSPVVLDGDLYLAQNEISKSGNAIKVILTDWNELIFRHEQPLFDFRGYQWLAFDIYIDSKSPDPTILDLTFRDQWFLSMSLFLRLNGSQYIEGGDLVQGQWQHVMVPFSAFGPALPGIRDIVLQLGPTGPATIYVENVELLGNP